MSVKDNLLKRVKSNEHMTRIFDIIGTKVDGAKRTADGRISPVSHSPNELRTIKNELWGMVQENYIADYGTNYRTYDDVCRFAKAYADDALKRCVQDGFYNPLNGIGTNFDPSGYTNAQQPLLLGPEEITAMYANGGITQIIIDKKSKGVQLNGFTLKGGKEFKAQMLIDLQQYAVSVGFNTLCDAIRDGNLYGGSIFFPIFKDDNPITVGMNQRQLMLSGVLKKDCISRFCAVDRWNTVTVPTYDLCAEDYMNPRSVYVPISGLEVHRDRIAFIRPKPQPYWSAIRQLGWGTSDITSYAASLKGYEIMMMSIPIMCQQMSLLVHQLPLDGIIAQNGPTAAKKWQAENEEQLRNWSILNPKAINSYGEIAVVNRTYTGFDNLVDAIRKDVSAKAGIPESVIFFSQPNGIFNKSEEDVLLKQSETIRMIQRAITPAVNEILPYLAVSLWGLPEGERSWEIYKTLSIDFDTPVVSSPSQKAVIAQNYTQAITQLAGAGMDIPSAVGFVAKLSSEVEVPSDMTAVLSAIPKAEVSPDPQEDVGHNIEGEPNETSSTDSEERSSVLQTGRTSGSGADGNTERIQTS